MNLLKKGTISKIFSAIAVGLVSLSGAALAQDNSLIHQASFTPTTPVAVTASATPSIAEPLNNNDWYNQQGNLQDRLASIGDLSLPGSTLNPSTSFSSADLNNTDAHYTDHNWTQNGQDFTDRGLTDVPIAAFTNLTDRRVTASFAGVSITGSISVGEGSNADLGPTLTNEALTPVGNSQMPTMDAGVSFKVDPRKLLSKFKLG